MYCVVSTAVLVEELELGMIGAGRSHEALLHPGGAPTITASLSRPQLDTTVCTVTGTINWDTMPLVRDVLVEAQRDDNVHLVIDLSTVTSMDSAGPYTLLEARFKHSIGGGGHLAVVADPNSQAIPELHIVALKAAFDFHSSLTEALHACGSVARSSDRVMTTGGTQTDRRPPTQRALLAASQMSDRD